MILDRQLQLEMLQKMSTTYPEFYNFREEYKFGTDDYNKVVSNLYYLMQHDLIESRSIMDSKSMSGLKKPQINLPTINQNGLDFLADDGGLSAILSVITIKFETQTLKAILATKINQSDLPHENKKSMIDALEDLPAESIKHLTTKLLDECVDNLPAAILLIGTWLGSF
ncbi:hypothetical protein [Acinetobacter tianfuensis]|uniref:Uncharacterized protein n=1 Tax=Acinetobacter tianfuensis TaxID=2419603 RepID=A0A3A8EHP5_9GAMM|nr:hypothetical protein [Acinetobacter tianfuensis]RKG33016.1 hypothetical protein D7V32_04260 [Acinetobacter tianfuensis]